MRGTEPVVARDPGSALPAHWHRGAFMQVFVRRWRDADGDGTGDLRGVTDSLDYLHALGVRGLWLMPVHPSEDGDHGYAVTDYRAVHPDYGTLDDLDALLAAAHARGIGVILDYVVNHSASTHPLFADSRRADSPFRDWYLWRQPHPPGWQIYGHDPWWRDASGASYFGAFSRRMPDFNWRCPEVVAWHHDNLRFWLNRGVDGFRLDACGHLVENGPDAWDCQPESRAIVGALRRVLDGYARRYLVAEAPGDPQGFAHAAGSAFAFDLNGALIAAARGDAMALAEVAHYFETAPPGMATLLSNHDSFAGRRAHDQLDGDPARLRRAAALYLLLPGTPFVYYGEELGLAGHPGLDGDAALRTPMPWAEALAQAARPDSLHAHYRALLALRNARPSLADGDYTLLALTRTRLVFRRRHGAEVTRVALDIAGGAAPLQPGRLLFAAPGIAVYDEASPSR